MKIYGCVNKKDFQKLMDIFKKNIKGFHGYTYPQIENEESRNYIKFGNIEVDSNTFLKIKNEAKNQNLDVNFLNNN